MKKITLASGLGALGACLTLSTTAFAENYEIDVRNAASAAAPVQQDAPAYPDPLVNSGQEGWVRMHFVVTPDGTAKDPIIIDSSGGSEFETEARKALEQWSFEPSESGVEDAHNIVNIHSEIWGSRNSVTRGFQRDHFQILRNLVRDENAEAREKLNELVAAGGFNMYESTALCCLPGAWPAPKAMTRPGLSASDARSRSARTNRSDPRIASS